MVESLSLNFRVFTVKLVGVQKFRNFTVLHDKTHTITSEDSDSPLPGNW